MIRRVTKIDNLVPVKTAVVSVFDKTGLDSLVPGLLKSCSELKIYSSGGTATHVRSLLGPQKDTILSDVSAYTGMPETEGGLVKTLHHKLFLGYLTETYCEGHQNDLKREGALRIDLVVCNLYPFEKVIAQPETTVEDARGHIDVGGPSMVRAAAKNFLRVAVVVDPGDYGMILNDLQALSGCLSLETRFKLAGKAFRHLSSYDKAIGEYLSGVQDFDKDVRALYDIA